MTGGYCDETVRCDETHAVCTIKFSMHLSKEKSQNKAIRGSAKSVHGVRCSYRVIATVLEEADDSQLSKIEDTLSITTQA